jgi:hypothetical protein
MKTQQQPKVTTQAGLFTIWEAGTEGFETNLSQFPQLWKILLFLATRQEENVGSLVDLDSIIRPKTVIVRVGNHQ